VPQCYAQSADFLVTFEGSNDIYVTGYTPLSWDPVDPKKIWHIVYGADTADQMANVMSISKTRSAGYVYVTDDVLPNPYDRLPSGYWDQEQATALQLPPVPLVPPTAPASLNSLNYTGTSIDLEWEPAVAGSAPIVAYDFYRGLARIGSVPATAKMFRADNLDPQTKYGFVVVARDALGQVSPPSPLLIEQTDQTYGELPPAPNKLAASGTGYTSTVLSWQVNPPGKKAPPITTVIVLQNGRPILRLPGTPQTVTVGKLAPGASYNFSVKVVDASGGVSQTRGPISVSTPALPDGGMIGNVSVTPAADGSSISYSADYLVPFAFRRVFIVTGDPTLPCWSTGSDPQVCADYVIENERLLQYTGSGTDWQWKVVRDVQPTINGANFTWTISPADIGSPAASTAVFNANGYAPNSYCGTDVACTAVGPPLPYE
jgi:chitodextrinase